MTVTWTFECPSCGQVITRPLREMSPDDICLEDRKPAVPAGHCAPSDDDYWTGSTGRILVNVADLVGTLPHPNSTRRHGCCGLDGLDGPNVVCSQGHEVAVERSDCWMAHAAVLLPEITRRKM
jgi:hypothetical protein